MALPAYLPEVQDSRVVLGPGQGQMATFIVAPGSADYVVGGYQITTTMTRLKFITGAWITGCNAQAKGFVPYCDFEIVQLASAITAGAGPGVGPPYSQTLGAGYSGYSQFLFSVYEQTASAGRLAELSTNYNLLGVAWMVTIIGD